MSEEQNLELSTISFPVDPSTIPTSREVPAGEIEFKVLSITAQKSKMPQPGEVVEKGPRKGQLKVGGKLMFKLLVSATAPESVNGIAYSEYFVIGTDDDPMAKKESTWTSKGTQLMGFFKKSKVNVKGLSPEQACLAAVGQHVGGNVVMEDNIYTDNNGVKHETKKPRVKSWFEAGTKLYRVHGEPQAPSANGNGFVAPAEASTSD